MSTPINPFTVDLRHAFRPMCRCESCTCTRIAAMKDGHILIAHMNQINQLTRDAAAAAFKQKEAEHRRLRFIEGIVAAAIHHNAMDGSSSVPISFADGNTAATNSMNQLVAAAGVLRISSS